MVVCRREWCRNCMKEWCVAMEERCCDDVKSEVSRSCVRLQSNESVLGFLPFQAFKG